MKPERHPIWDSIDVLTGEASTALEYHSPAQRFVDREASRKAVVEIDAFIANREAAETRLAEAGAVLGQVIVACSLRPYESLSQPLDHAAIDAVRSLLTDRDRLHSMHEDETTWRKHAEAKLDSARKADGGGPMVPMHPQIARDTREALDGPRIGDRFQEMYSYWVYVLEVTDEAVTYCYGNPPCTFSKLCPFPKLRTTTRAEFARRDWMHLEGRGHDVSGWLDRLRRSEAT